MTSALLAAALLVPAAPAKPPNVVVLIADDLAADDLPPFGNPAVKAPNLSKLAADGMRFDRAFVTSSSCSPSRCSLLSGRYPHSHGAPQLHQPLPKDQPTLTAALRKAGYWTAIAGKTHLGPTAEATFDLVRRGGGPSGCEQWVPTLRDRPKDKPFFLWLAAMDPHRDYQPGAIPEPHDPAKVVIPPYLPDTPEVRKDLALYYDEVGRLDRYVGEVLAELDRQGVANETLVVFLSDNGRPFPRCKTTLYDSGTRTPLIARWPGKIKPGTSCGSLVSTIDLAPTVLSLAGAEVPAAMQGTSIAKLFEDPAATAREHVFTEKNWHDFDDHARAVRTTRYKYIRNNYTDIPLTPPADAVRGATFQAMRALRDDVKLTPAQHVVFSKPRPFEELYDLEADPHELKNLAGLRTHAQQLKELREVLDRWAKETNDTIPAMRTPDRFDRETGVQLKKK